MQPLCVCCLCAPPCHPVWVCSLFALIQLSGPFSLLFTVLVLRLTDCLPFGSVAYVLLFFFTVLHFYFSFSYCLSSKVIDRHLVENWGNDSSQLRNLNPYLSNFHQLFIKELHLRILGRSSLGEKEVFFFKVSHKKCIELMINHMCTHTRICQTCAAVFFV